MAPVANAAILVLPVAFLCWYLRFRRARARREAALQALVMLGAATLAITEALSPFGLLARGPLLAVWVLIALLSLARAGAHPRTAARPAARDLPAIVMVAAIAGIAAVVAVTALISPPNSADAMAYHMPRVIYWAQAGSVRFFPTSYYPQISLQPLAEYTMLHTWLLSGGDWFINLAAWTGWTGSAIAVSLIAGALGLGMRAQAFTALFCATLPAGILQGSGAKNDSLLALWLTAAVYFTVRFAKDGRRRDAAFLGVAAGLACATKGTAYLFGPPLLAATALLAGRRGKPTLRQWGLGAAYAAAGVLLANGPQYARNYRLSGSVLGFDSAHGDGLFRWRNDAPGWQSTVSNALRHASDQLGGGSARWNQAVNAAVLRAHRLLGLDPQDPRTTWKWSAYEPPRNSNHEANAHNRWHLLLLFVALLPAAYHAARRRDPRWLSYAGGLAAAFLAFCFYLKWQPFLARLELPLFVAAAPLAGFLFANLRPRAAAAAICLLLLNNSRPFLFENWTRPWNGPRSIFRVPREEQYFSDMGQWDSRASYLRAAEAIASAACADVGIDISRNQLEYPLQALLRRRLPGARFVHAGVENRSAAFPVPGEWKPCALVCLDCAGDADRLSRYAGFGAPVEDGRSLIFVVRR